jgi:hypothetical protein
VLGILKTLQSPDVNKLLTHYISAMRMFSKLWCSRHVLTVAMNNAQDIIKFPVFRLKIQLFGERIATPSSGGNYSVLLNCGSCINITTWQAYRSH